jgi:hypothetical protein
MTLVNAGRVVIPATPATLANVAVVTVANR